MTNSLFLALLTGQVAFRARLGITRFVSRRVGNDMHILHCPHCAYK